MDIDFSNLKLPSMLNTLDKINKIGLAEGYYQRISNLYNQFSVGLKKNQFLLVEMINPNGEIITVNSFSYYNPDMILINGFNSNNEKVTMVTHKNNVQLSFTIKEINESGEKGTPLKIGFQSGI